MSLKLVSAPRPPMAADHDLVVLLQRLKARDYRFTAVTPETHRRVLERDPGPARSLREVFGWNKPLGPADGWEILEGLPQERLLQGEGDARRAALRVASVGDDLFLHSSFPTDHKDAVFLGPDTYRFVRLLGQKLAGQSFGRVIDLGAGPGAGAIALSRLARIEELRLVDVNPAALRLAAANAAAAGVAVKLVLADGLDATGDCDLVIANPPFIAGSDRTYSGGGGDYGTEVAFRWAEQALDALGPRGRMIMYTGSPILEGEDPFKRKLLALAEARDVRLGYEEIDPDIFGEELEGPAYAGVDRIAAVAVDLMKAPCSSPARSA